jgi:predicted ATPase
LFVERARAVKPNFALTEENAQSVAEICLRLDGLPLAIELAAARAKIISPQSILERLENRLKLLTGGAKDLPVRQQTVRGTVEWSYELLAEDEKILFHRLAVFAGGFTFEAAEAVCANYELRITNYKLSEDQKPKTKNQIEILDGITSLLNNSLLAQKEQADGESRFRMLEVVREYALESLEASGEAKAMRHNHAAYFLALGEKAEPLLQFAESVKWLNRLEEEHDNLRAVLQWSLENDTETATRLAAAIRFFWFSHSHITEAREWLEKAVSKSRNVSVGVRIKLLNGLGVSARNQGDYEMS